MTQATKYEPKATTAHQPATKRGTSQRNSNTISIASVIRRLSPELSYREPRASAGRG